MLPAILKGDVNGESMNVSDAIEHRISVRAFQDRPVPKALVAEILEKAARAPGWQQVRVLSIYAKIDDGEQSSARFEKELRAHMAPDACVLSP